MPSSLFRASLFVSVLAYALLLVTDPVCCSNDEDTLLQGLNSYRQTSGIPALSKNNKAGCLADEIADQMDDNNKNCIMASPLTTSVDAHIQIKDYPKLLDKCDIDVNTTKDGAILPVCVPNLVPTLVLTNYTQTNYSRYVNDSKYTGVGLGSDDNWMVVVLTTSTPTGRFESGARSAFKIGMSHLVFWLPSVLLLVVN